MGNGRNNPGNNNNDKNDSDHVPLSRRDDPAFGETTRTTYDSTFDVKNSLPPPRNPNRDGGSKDDE